MNRLRWAAGAVALTLVLLTAAAVRADRVPSHKTVMPADPGVRGDITVPYLTNGNTALGVWQGVAPRVYASPNLSDPKNPQARPVYNLPFYGATHAFGDQNDGAVSQPKTAVPH